MFWNRLYFYVGFPKPYIGAISSVVERFVHIEEVAGSIPASRTTKIDKRGVIVYYRP